MATPINRPNILIDSGNEPTGLMLAIKLRKKYPNANYVRIMVVLEKTITDMPNDIIQLSSKDIDDLPDGVIPGIVDNAVDRTVILDDGAGTDILDVGFEDPAGVLAEYHEVKQGLFTHGIIDRRQGCYIVPPGVSTDGFCFKNPNDLNITTLPDASKDHIEAANKLRGKLGYLDGNNLKLSGTVDRQTLMTHLVEYAKRNCISVVEPADGRENYLESDWLAAAPTDISQIKIENMKSDGTDSREYQFQGNPIAKSAAAPFNTPFDNIVVLTDNLKHSNFEAGLNVGTAGTDHILTLHIKKNADDLRKDNVDAALLDGKITSHQELTQMFSTKKAPGAAGSEVKLSLRISAADRGAFNGIPEATRNDLNTYPPDLKGKIERAQQVYNAIGNILKASVSTVNLTKADGYLHKDDVHLFTIGSATCGGHPYGGVLVNTGFTSIPVVAAGINLLGKLDKLKAEYDVVAAAAGFGPLADPFNDIKKTIKQKFIDAISPGGNDDEKKNIVRAVLGTEGVKGKEGLKNEAKNIADSLNTGNKDSVINQTNITTIMRNAEAVKNQQNITDKKFAYYSFAAIVGWAFFNLVVTGGDPLNTVYPAIDAFYEYYMDRHCQKYAKLNESIVNAPLTSPALDNVLLEQVKKDLETDKANLEGEKKTLEGEKKALEATRDRLVDRSKKHSAEKKVLKQAEAAAKAALAPSQAAEKQALADLAAMTTKYNKYTAMVGQPGVAQADIDKIKQELKEDYERLVRQKDSEQDAKMTRIKKSFADLLLGISQIIATQGPIY